MLIKCMKNKSIIENKIQFYKYSNKDMQEIYNEVKSIFRINFLFIGLKLH